jgi:hypothetical protein
VRYRATVIGLIILFGAFTIKGKNRDFLGGGNDLIVWNKDYKLKWDDFQGQGDTAKVIGAASTCSINYNHIPIRGEDSLKILVEAVFLKKDSPKIMWRLEASNFVVQALQHEQIHFDITEVYARKFRKIIFAFISRAKRKNSAWLLYKLSPIYFKIQVECQNEQKEFDKAVSFVDTPGEKSTGFATVGDYAIVKEKQEKWRQKVDKELNELYSYVQTSFTIKVKKNTAM